MAATVKMRRRTKSRIVPVLRNRQEYINTPVMENAAQLYILAWCEYTASIGMDISIRQKYRAPSLPNIR
jgi:hypothetical protein